MSVDLPPYPAIKDSAVAWLGEVPDHWTTERLKSSMHNIVEQTTERRAADLYVALEHVESWTGRLRHAGLDVSFDSQVKCFRSGDVLFGKLRPYLAKVTRPTSDGICVGEFLVLRPRHSNATAPYMEQLLRSKPIIDAVNSSTFGAKMPRADWQFMGGMAIALPPLPEQAAIVRFLDYADRRIRRYIRAKQQLITLLEEQKQALIHHAVTRGLDPNVRLKPSRVEWLGEVPERWQVCRSKRMFRPRRELARPNDIQLSATQAYGVISQRRYEERVGRKVVRILRHLEKRRHVEVDDFVMSMRSFQGGLERAWESGCIRSSYIVLRPATKLVVGYFGHLFKSAGYINALRSTANFIRDGQDLNFENYCRVDLPLPAIEEQQRIAQFLEQATTAIRLAVERYRGQVDLIREYRTRLIADVVTGKLDVREAAARLPDEVEEPEPLDETDALTDGEDEPSDDLDAVAAGAEV